MQRNSFFLFLFSLLFLSACAGVDTVEDPIIPEKISITPRLDSLVVGKEQVFAVKYTNQYGTAEAAKNLVWRSSDPTKISIDATGKAKTLALGKTTLYATNGKATDSLVLNQNSATNGGGNTGGGTGGGGTNTTVTFLKTGTFQRISGSYNIAGSVRVQTVGGVTQIITSENFSVSAGPSLHLLLTNHTTGSYSVMTGGNTVNAVSAQITQNRLSTFSGALTWTVPAGVNPANYKYVVFYCTLGPVFGAAELK
jgi:Electron transfer DM13/Bacterial Ig-like domain (group 2)